MRTELQHEPIDEESTLPLPTNADALWQEYQRTKDAHALNSFVSSFTETAKHLARRFAGRSPDPLLDEEELLSIGLLEGIMENIDSFDSSARIRPSVYFRQKVYLQMHNQHLKAQGKKRQAARNTTQLHISRIDDQLPLSEQRRDRVSAEICDVVDVIFKLCSRFERSLLKLYYQENLSMKAIGEMHGLSEGRISQIHSALLDRVREALKDNPDMPRVCLNDQKKKLRKAS